MKTAKPKSKQDLPGQLAAAFERTMHQLTLLGHNLPKTAEGLTPQQLRLLWILAFADGPLTMAQAAGLVGITPGTLTEGAKRLVKNGLVTRQRNAADDRVVELSLSAKGTRLFADIRRSREAFFRELCGGLDEETCRELIRSHLFIAETYARVVQQNKGGVP